MKKSPKLYLVLGLALLLGSLLAIYISGVTATPVNQVALHQSSDTITESACRSCHPRAYEKAMESPPVDPDLWWDAHFTHQERTVGLLAFYDKDTGPYDGCGKCHPSTDIREESGATLRKQVNPGIPGSINTTVECLDCHGTYATRLPDGTYTSSVPQHVRNDLPDTGCMTSEGCHTGLESPGASPQAAHTGVSYIGQIMTQAGAYCLKCHGGRAFYKAEETN